jgi:hypothetical protein
MASVWYGAIFGISFFISRKAPQPAGSIVFWSLMAAHQAWIASIFWRRAALPFATAAYVTGTVVSICFATLAALGRPYPNWTLESWVWFGAITALVVFLLRFESRVNRAKWQRLQQSADQAGLWDILTGRHVPDLRRESS